MHFDCSHLTGRFEQMAQLEILSKTLIDSTFRIQSVGWSKNASLTPRIESTTSFVFDPKSDAVIFWPQLEILPWILTNKYINE